MKIKSIPAFVLIVALNVLLAKTARAQDADGKKDTLALPVITGYITLKCDFHMHTVFSDGHVWPTFRVNEAVRDGLDAISLTEHIDYEGFPEVIQRDYNKSYDIAVEAAKKKGLMIIRGAEISPRVPPYHNNALFLQDANKIPFDYMKSGKKQFVMKDVISHDELMGPFLEAQKQGAFVFYNHPGYSWWDKKDTSIFTSFHKELFEKGILKGVEVVNSGRYNIIAHRIAMKYNLTMVCNTDEHYDMFARYYKTHRPMTLVFAKERSVEGIREALLARRTALYFDDYIIARQPEAELFFKSSLAVSSVARVRNGEPIITIKVLNRSDLAYKTRVTAAYAVEGYPLGQVTLKPRDTTVIILKATWDKPAETKIRIEVANIVTSPDNSLVTDLVITPEPAKLD